jgi:hypothetical protein
MYHWYSTTRCHTVLDIHEHTLTPCNKAATTFSVPLRIDFASSTALWALSNCLATADVELQVDKVTGAEAVFSWPTVRRETHAIGFAVSQQHTSL